ncbi:unnamed protein product [Linum tenue]
MRYLV